jgi:hypothetical protein
MADQGGTDPRETHRKIIRRSMEDEFFRQELLRNPKSTLERELGAPLPEGVDVRAVEDTADTVHLVLPSKSLSERGELSDEDLDAVAGGTISNPYTAPACQCPDTSVH